MRGVAVVGNGVVGSVVAGCFALLGRSVVGVETDPAKLAGLRSGTAPVYEDGLDELLAAGIAAGRLRFTGDLGDALAHSSVVFVCVGSGAEAIDVSRRVLDEGDDHIVVVKSTLPIGTTRQLVSARVVCNPEFLRQGRAVGDFLHPDRLVLGGDDPAAIDAVADLYRPVLEQTVPGHRPASRPVLVRTSIEAAEMIKHAANAFLALKVSYANEIANICAAGGVDVRDVTEAVGLDARIGPAHLSAGLGWGGSCLGKDLGGLIDAARALGYEPHLLAEAAGVNDRQRRLAVAKLEGHLGTLAGRRICLLGLAFKPGTDDLRDAPALAIAEALSAAGAEVTAYDPVVRTVAGRAAVRVMADPYGAAAGADAVVLVTEWPEFGLLDFAELRRRMRGDLFVDGRNVLAGVDVGAAGFVYESFGAAADGRRLRPVRMRAIVPATEVSSVVETPRRSQASPR
jgi:UDPglucose 6-dehydrogenase